MKIPVRVQNDRFKAGYIEVVPLVKIYSKELKDYLGSVQFSPDSDYSIFPGELLEDLVDIGEPFECLLNLSDIADPLTVYISE